MSENQPDFQLRLRPLPAGVPAAVRLRRFLKQALRAAGFRCIKVEELSQADGADPKPVSTKDRPWR
jgi:hypothetical protein